MLAAKEKKFAIPKETKYQKDIHTAADHVMREEDRVIRWKKIHSLLRKNNKKARKEQDQTAKDCRDARDEKWFKNEKSGVMGLRFGVALPPITYAALVQADRLIDGHSELAEPSKEDYAELAGTNQIVKDLAKAFPQYKVVK